MAKTAGKPRLRPSQAKFVKEYANPKSSTFSNGQRSYLKVKPNVSEAYAAVAANRMINNDKVRAAIRQELSLADIKGIMQDVIERASDKDDLARVESAGMSYAKLGGYLIDKQEIKNLPDGDRLSAAEILRQQLRGEGVTGN